ncbi:MAG: hypothetical protein ABI593_08055, partial [Betaproteobacteria bacterium]
MTNQKSGNDTPEINPRNEDDFQRRQQGGTPDDSRQQQQQQPPRIKPSPDGGEPEVQEKLPGRDQTGDGDNRRRIDEA